jgi:hypothetical protein
MSNPPNPDPEDSGDLSYEDFEDLTWKDGGDLEPIDLDALDDEVEPVVEDEATGELLEAIDTLDDEIPPAGEKAPAAPKPAPAPQPQPEAESPVQAEAEPEPPGQETGAEQAAESAEAQAPAAGPAAEAPAQAAAEPAAEAAPAPAGEQAAKPVEAATPAAETVATAETPPAPPPVTYQVLLGLPPDLGAQVLELRTTGEIVDTPPPGIALTARFNAADLPAVETVLADWVRAHLPLQLETTGIVAEVVGGQQYAAAWTLEPGEELAEAQHELMHALAPLITLLSDAPAAFNVRVTISDHVPARRYPQVIAQMQREFETYVWHATELMLVQRPQDGEPGEWGIAKTFD